MSIVSVQKREMSFNDTVILWGGRDWLKTIKLTPKGQVHTKNGLFEHESFVGKKYGSKILSRGEKGWLYALFPSPDLWTKALPLRTQILYAADISMILMHLELKPGSIVLEAGTGSGSLSTAIARTISPNGKLYTFELDSKRFEAAKADFKMNGIDHLIQVTNRNVCEEGFQMKEIADAVFLDLPSPWEAIKSVKEALKSNGNFCGFSPCIEQVQKTCEALRNENFCSITTIECLLKGYDVRPIEWESLNFHNEPPPQQQQQQLQQNDIIESMEIEQEKEGEERKNLRKRNRESMEQQNENNKDSTSIMVVQEENPEKNNETSTSPSSTSNRHHGVIGQKEYQKRVTLEKKTRVQVKPFSEIRGHTGYLTFAKKFP